MNKRNYFWDFWKFIAAIGVILVHVPFRGTLGTIMDCVGTWGVTFFFLISGFALAGDNRIICGKILKRLRRNGIITAIAVAAYFLFSYLWARRDNGSFLLWKVALRKPITYVKMLFLGDFECIYGTALWFMIALLYCYLIFYILIRFNLNKVIYILLPIFLIIRIVVDVRVISYGGDWHLSANALVAGDKYLIVGIKGDTYKALGKQAANNRPSEDVTPVDNVITLVPATTNLGGVFELTLGQADDLWTLYDAVNEGYLCAASSSVSFKKGMTSLL